MTIAFIADLHLTPDRPQSTILFEQFLKTGSRVLSELYILGDLFEYWIGDDAGSRLGYRSTESALKAVSDQGTQIYFIHGNRDFLVGQDFAERTGCQILPDPHPIVLDGIRVVLSHGDHLCTDDVSHQQARSQMLTSKWKMAFLDQPIEKRIDDAEALRAKSEENKKMKSMAVMDVNQLEVAKLVVEHQADILIHGHTHRPGVHEFEASGKSRKRFVVGDWYTQKSVLTYENSNFMLKC